MAVSKLKLNQLQQEGANSNEVIAWNGSTWAPTVNGTGTVSSITLTQPAAGITITGSGTPITTTGTPTFALANDLAGLEGLSTTGLAVRTGDGTWNTRSIAMSASTSAFVGVGGANTDGVSGNPTFTLNTNSATNKLFVQAVATTNITKSGTQTIDGVSLTAGQRVLLTGQTSSQENGIWDVSAGSWTRSTDADAASKWDTGILVHVKLGTTNGATYWKLDTKGPFTVDTTPLTYSKVFTSSADGNGIYSGSGNIASAAVATVATGSSFTVDYFGGVDAIKVDDSASSTKIQSKNTNYSLITDNSSTSLTSPVGTLTMGATSFDLSTGIGGPYLSSNSTDIAMSKDSNQVLVNASYVGLVAPYFYLVGHNSTTQAELRLYEQSSVGSNYTAFKTQNQSADITYNLPSTNADGLMLNGSSTLSWGTATNTHLSSGVGGIYKGSGTIASAAVSTVTSGSTFTIDYNGGVDAIRVSDSASSVTIKSKDNSQVIFASNSGVGMNASTNGISVLLTNILIEAATGDLTLSGGDTDIILTSTSAQFTTPYLAITNGANQSELRMYERSGAGSNYTAFVTQDQSATVTYTLPAAAPASNGYVLSGTTAGTLSWIANGGADGNGIYSGSGTIASNAVATVTSGASFTIDYNGGNNAISISDSAGSVTLGAKTSSTGFIGIDSSGVGIYSGSDQLTLIESNGGAELNTDLRIYNGKLLLDSVSSPAQITSNQNNYSLSATAAVLRVSTDASRNLTGIANSGTMQDGRVLTIVNVGSFDLVLTTEDTNSTAANRFALGESNVTLKSSESITLWYDTTTDRWRPIDYRASAAGSSGDIINGGNTTGSAVTIGTNDAFDLNFETSGVTRMSITGGASTGGATTITNVTANTNTVQDVLTLRTNSTGTAAASFGPGILLQAESSTTDNQDLARIAGYWTTATHASREGALSFQLGDNAGALAEVMKLDRTTSTGILSIGSTTPVTISNDALTTAASFTVGNSSQNLIVGGSSGLISVTTSSTSSTAIELTPNANAASSTAGIVIGNISNFGQTSGTRDYMRFAYGLNPTSGTAIHNQLVFNGTFNQTGGANGIIRSVYVNPTLTAVADYRGVDLPYSAANAKGIYQSGSTTTNNFVGRTSFGTTNAPHASASIDIVSTTTGLGLPAMTATQRNSISSPREGLVVFDTTNNLLSVYSNSAWMNLSATPTGFPTLSYNSQSGTSYTLVASDAGKMIRASNAATVTITVPANSSVAYATGTIIYVEQTGAGAVTLSPAGGVTILTTARTTPAQYSAIHLYKIDTDTWNVIGGTV